MYVFFLILRSVHPNLVMMLNLESVSSVIAFSEMESAREGRDPAHHDSADTSIS